MASTSLEVPGSSGISNNRSNLRLSKYSKKSQDFTIIWHNLTYKASPKSWYNRLQDRIFRTVPPSEPDEFISNQRHDVDQQPRQLEGGQKIILDKLSGYVKSRQLTAIMGPSGAGKSTLLHCLFQGRTGCATGQILVDSNSKNKLKVCFIPQHDCLNEWLTVREDLIFVSKLKLARLNTIMGNHAPSNDPSAHNSIEIDSYVRQLGRECCTSLIDHEADALRVAELMGLSNCLNVTIKNISGGQKKRLSIARELMSKPDVLILDEPTTGLDSLTCYKTITTLKDLAHHSTNPMAVVVTIHQPQREVFNLFDKAYFITSSGRVIYEDSPQVATQTIKAVAHLDLPLPNYNPASLLIEIASGVIQGSARINLEVYHKSKFYEIFSSKYLETLVACSSNNQSGWKFRNFEDKNSLLHELSQMMKFNSSSADTDNHTTIIDNFIQPNCDTINITESPDVNLLNRNDRMNSDVLYISHQLRNCLASHSNSLGHSFRHVFILTHRSWLSIIRNPTFTRSRFIFHTLLPLMMLAVFGRDMGRKTDCPDPIAQLTFNYVRKSLDSDIVTKNVEETRLSMENVSFFFILIYGFGINLISATASFYPLTMHMFKKETINGLYSPGPYFIGQMLAELPLEIIFPSLSIMISYPLTGQLSSFLEWRMFTVAYIIFLVSYSTHALGLLFGAVYVNNISVAVLMGQFSLLPQIMLSGFLIRESRMPGWMHKLSYLSPYKHGVIGIISARYGFDSCHCDKDKLPEDGENVTLDGLRPNVRNVIDYMFPKNNSTGNVSITEVLDKLGQKFVQSQTFGLKIRTCEDVKPHMMHIFNADDLDLFLAILWLIVFIVVIKLITFSIMKTFPYRIN